MACVSHLLSAMPSRMSLALLALSLSFAPAFAQTPETLAAADRLIAAQDPQKMLSDMATATAAQLPGATEEQKKVFVAEMTDPAFVKRFLDESRKAMARHFTTDELNALANFYSQPIAKSAMSKMGPYTGEIMTFVQREIPVMIQRMQNKQ